MTGYLLRRLASTLPTLVGITLVAFAVLHLLPGDPLERRSPEAAGLSAEAGEHLRTALPEEAAIGERYLRWVSGLLRGDLGVSRRGGRRPVGGLIAEALPWTVLLNLTALAAIYGLGLPFGFLAAARPGSILDRLGTWTLMGLYVMPAFAAALLLQQVFAVHLGLLPLHGVPEPGAGRAPALLRHAALPAACLALTGWAFVARYSREAFRAARRRSYVAAARARGVTTRRAWGHIAADAAVPLLTLLAGVLPGLVGGSVIVEQIFSWPGVGRLYLASIEGRDEPVVLGLTLLSAAAILAAQVLVDLLYALADPRARTGLSGDG
jgi:peptide/nickel transport system permease protein